MRRNKRKKKRNRSENKNKRSKPKRRHGNVNESELRVIMYEQALKINELESEMDEMKDRLNMTSIAITIGCLTIVVIIGMMFLMELVR